MKVAQQWVSTDRVQSSVLILGQVGSGHFSYGSDQENWTDVPRSNSVCRLTRNLPCVGCVFSRAQKPVTPSYLLEMTSCASAPRICITSFSSFKSQPNDGGQMSASGLSPVAMPTWRQDVPSHEWCGVIADVATWRDAAASSQTTLITDLYSTRNCDLYTTLICDLYTTLISDLYQLTSRCCKQPLFD